jgi:exonuclease SbcC
MDILLDYANKHLEVLTKRYKLEKTGDTLALQVVDNDMLGEVRTIHSLSGGESFLISLSLALGLSALSSNRMQIESLFIDEGFGSLDTDTLNVAIDALENLYTQGRKIGIISHVGEMRIPTQIKVIKSVNGKSKIKITGNN